MTTEVRFHRVLTVLLTAALLATLTVALTGGQRAEAVDGPVEVVYVATGQNFPDALAGANLAATVGAPMLTVNPDLPIPDPTITALQALDPDQIIILGGPVAVSDAVRGALADYARSGAVTRIEGGDRHDTAAQIADALPSKVHDADQLDGLDSSDFLRSNATIDADSLGGKSADAFASTDGDTFTGTVVAPKVQYSSPRSHQVSIASHAFLPPHDSLAYLHNASGVGADLGAHSLSAPVSLPDGATVTDLDLHFVDATAGTDLVATLYRRGIGGGSPAPMASGRSTGNGGAVSASDSSIANAVVDNGQYVYFMTLQPITNDVPPDPGSWNGSDLLFAGAAITYTLTEAP